MNNCSVAHMRRNGKLLKLMHYWVGRSHELFTYYKIWYLKFNPDRQQRIIEL